MLKQRTTKADYASRQGIALRLFGAWVWIVLAVFLSASQADALAEEFNYRSADTLSAPHVSPELVVATFHAPQICDGHPTPAPPFAAGPSAAFSISRFLPSHDSAILPFSATCSPFSLPRPPPLA